MAAVAIAGKMTARYNGRSIRAVGSFEINSGVDKREPVVGLDRGVEGFKVMPQPATVKGMFLDGPEVDIDAVKDITDGAIEIELVTGKIFVLREAFYTGEGSHSIESGEIELMLSGSSGEYVS